MTTQPDLLARITVRPDIFGGKPIIRDMRIAVEHVLGKLAAGDTPETILREFPELEPEDIHACFDLPTCSSQESKCMTGWRSEGFREAPARCQPGGAVFVVTRKRVRERRTGDSGGPPE